MPRSVIVATTVLILMMVLRLVSVLLPAAFMLLLGEVDVETAYAVVGSLLSLGFGALLVAGFFTGHRLAWQWGRLVVIFAVYSTILVPYTATRYGPIAAAIEFSVSPLPLFVIFFSLGRESARKYFRLQCPECQAFTVKAADFLFSRARCRACNTSWTSSAQLDPIAEDVNSSKYA